MRRVDVFLVVDILESLSVVVGGIRSLMTMKNSIFLYSFLLKKNKEGVKLRMRFCISFF